MASKSPITDSTVKAPAPVAAPVSAPAVTAAAAPAPKADPAPVAKVDAAPAPKAEAKPVVAKAPVAKVAAQPVTAAKRKPVAKKKVVAKAAVKSAPTKTIKIKPAAATSVAPKIIAIKPVVAKAKAVIQKEVTVMEATLKTAADKAKTLFADANDRAKAAVEKSTKAFEEINEFNKGNIEAIVESGKIAAKGFETLGQDAAEYSRKQFEGATAALKSLSTVKSPTDFFKLHSDYVRSSFDAIVAQTSKNTEAVLKLAGEVAQPISNRVAVAVEKVKIAA
ncbi:phasin family protein [Sphingomonas sp. ERG5]|uniref:phasin family protein n=1 Tax=Sphingomonas sp. ERG5 TaxID=1381597 RepID=UPI0009DECB13|nr:phasin family protein [Sphingomonas sp. ERG5]